MPFKKGKSGNPGGRPKEGLEVKSLARDYTIEAVNRLVFWLRSENAKASVSAANALLDRGFGKPAQSIDMTVNPIRTARELSEVELDERIARAIAGKKGPDTSPGEPAGVH